jgi:S1-C subfamily serine protease
MIDQEGNVVGIDTALMNPQEAGGSIGIGFAIPSDAARFVIGRLLDPAHPKPGWLGITLQDLTPGLSDALGLKGVKGSISSVLDTDGPASTAGLRLGDVLTGIDTLQPIDARAFMRAIIRLPVGQPVQLTVWSRPSLSLLRNGQTLGRTAAFWTRMRLRQCSTRCRILASGSRRSLMPPVSDMGSMKS